MLIDWFTVGAQALNFIILVWLMKRFLYKPILNAIDAREKRIAAEIADADAKKADAKREGEAFRVKNETFDKERAALTARAEEEAKAEGVKLLAEARKTADVLSGKRRESLRNDARNLNQAIVRRTQDKVFAIARKTLGDLATVDLEERIAEVFIRRLRVLDGKSKEVLAQALKSRAEPAILRSAFDLPEGSRATIQNALNETFSTEIHLRFETAPALVGGIELAANGQKIAWTISEYLANLESGIMDLVDEKPAPDRNPNNPPTTVILAVGAADGNRG